MSQSHAYRLILAVDGLVVVTEAVAERLVRTVHRQTVRGTLLAHLLLSSAGQICQRANDAAGAHVRVLTLSPARAANL